MWQPSSELVGLWDVKWWNVKWCSTPVSQADAMLGGTSGRTSSPTSSSSSCSSSGWSGRYILKYFLWRWDKALKYWGLSKVTTRRRKIQSHNINKYFLKCGVVVVPDLPFPVELQSDVMQGGWDSHDRESVSKLGILLSNSTKTFMYFKSYWLVSIHFTQ